MPRQNTRRLGLSPRVRGNRRPRVLDADIQRSIPACAGEPGPLSGVCRQKQVYPRVCGGTVLPIPRGVTWAGLSPRVRGNLYPAATERWQTRSIPACAGEPMPPGAARPRMWVYPRVCGGTTPIAESSRKSWGLSPRVRGNPGPETVAGTRIGSIPACAGEPWRPGMQSGPPGVYPRVCGGTPAQLGVAARKKGLSPRVRGNLLAALHDDQQRGSIPACAGEPCQRQFRPFPAEVYPRVCGGTGPKARPGQVWSGLSPRVRGNRPAGSGLVPSAGSIPACAGEPGQGPAGQPRPRVYPRVCGGTWASGRRRKR